MLEDIAIALVAIIFLAVIGWIVIDNLRSISATPRETSLSKQEIPDEKLDDNLLRRADRRRHT